MLITLKESIFNATQESFNDLAIKIFRYQSVNNSVYREYLNLINVKPKKIDHFNEIPFLPIELFKSHKIKTGNFKDSKTFISSGTTSKNNSKHHIYDIKLYEDSFMRTFEMFYGKPEEYCILALLPGYLERSGSSLVYMVDYLIKNSGHPDSGFYLNEYDQLIKTLRKLESDKQKTILLGVSYALLDLGEQITFPLKHTIIMETGGMKGKRKELTKNELHSMLRSNFKVDNIHSEYGMTELLSQAYSKSNGQFFCPSWMKVLIRDVYDPYCNIPNGLTGGINVIDLANIYSCAFIETKDLGKIQTDGSFQILGRFDSSDIRGCNLLIDR